MDSYIKGNKEAWEEAFENRNASWGANITDEVQKEAYAFFYEDMAKVLKKYDLKGKTIGQFCCNNGRELLSLVKTTDAKNAVGFDIAKNMIDFANEKAKELNLPCQFVEANILEIGEEYYNQFDMVLITIGALCWFKNLKDFFAVISKCMKKDGVIVIQETHPFYNMLAFEGDEGYDANHPLNCVFSYFDHEWLNSEGMYYITGKNYHSKTFTDYTHSLSDIIGAMCNNGIDVTGLQEFDYDISEAVEHLNHKEVPLSMIIEGRKV